MAQSFALGAVVVNFSTVARVVGYHVVSVPGHPSNGDPILRELSAATGRLRGGKWVADPAKCRVLGDDEVQRYLAGDRSVVEAGR